MTRSPLVAIVASLATMTPTAQSDDFPSGSAITFVGGTSAATLDPGAAYNNVYTVHYSGSLTINASSSTFGTATLVVAIETNDGSGWVERATASFLCGYTTSWPPPYAARTCPWSDPQQAITIAGLGLTDGIRLKAKSFSTSNNAGGSFVIRGGDGAGANPGTYNGVTYATEPYGVSVGPDPGSQSVYAGSTGNVATFTVQNLGSQGELTYALSVVGCTAPLANCTSDAPSVTVGQGLTQNATVHFDAQNTTGTGSIVLRATHTASGTTDDGTINVSLQSFAVEVGPDPGSTSVGVGMTGQVATFTVKNNGNQGQITYALSVVTCSAPLLNCTSDAGSVPVAQGATVNATVHFDAPSLGTGAIVLRATHAASGTSNDGTINVTVNPPNYAVQVGPDPGSSGALIESVGNVATFTVQNQGNQGAVTYALSIVGCTAPLINCTSDAATVTVGQGATQNATVHFDALYMTGTGTITLRATHTPSGTSNDGTINVTIMLAHTDDFPSGSAITLVGWTSAATLNPGGASDNIYTVHYSGSLTISGHSETFGTATLVVAIETNDGSGWVERSAASYLCGYTTSWPPPYAARTCSWSDPQQAITVAGLGLTDGIRLKAKSFSTSNGAPGLFEIRGGDGAGANPGTYNGVTYKSDAPPSYILSQVNNGVLTLDSRFLLQETAEVYDGTGRVTRVTDARNVATEYLFGGNASNAFLTQVKRVDPAGTNHMVTDITYLNGFVAKIRDPGGSVDSFTYDAYGRLRQVMNNARQVVRAYGYVYSRTSPNWAFDAANPNHVVDSTFITPSISVEKKQYIDGLGRPIQTVVRSGSEYHVTARQYDLMGRVWRTWNPYRRDTPGFDPNFSAAATDSAKIYHGVSAARPYVETAYTPDALGRVKQVTPQYTGSTSPGAMQYAYGVDLSMTPRLYTETSDELGKKTRSYTDGFGHTVQSILGFGTSDATVTQFVNDVLGQRMQATDPRGLVTTYTIDTRGLLNARTTPDAGTVNSKYDQAGNLRFSQDANHAGTPEKASFTNYDFAARPLVSGVGGASFASLQPDAAPTALETSTGNWLVVRRYDAKPTTGPSDFPWNRFPDQIAWNRFVNPTSPPPLTLGNVSGRLAAIASKSNGAWQITLFSYDGDGRIATRYTFTEANGGASVLTAVNARDSVERDLRDALTVRRLMVGTSTFNQWYHYDSRGLLSQMFASTSPNQPAADVTNLYRPGDMPASYQLQGSAQAVPIRYTIRGQTEKIGDPATTTHPFSARYAYHANGTIAEAEFYNQGAPGTLDRYKFVLGLGSYDALNRLKGGDFSIWNAGAWTTTAAHDLGGTSFNGILYNLSGGITALQRNRQQTPFPIDNLTYTIAATSNRITSIAEAAGSSTEPWDAEAAAGSAITYDANGNLTKWSASPYSITAITYDHQNLPLIIQRSSGGPTSYRYDAAGQRIAKQDGTGPTVVYLRDGPTTLAVFTVTGATATSWHFNLVWKNRIVGRQPNGTAPRRYYHFDILRSTRAVVQGTSVVESYDFDPWGLLMPGRTLAGPTREGFTSKERDVETGLDYFGARYYMAALGQWSSPDPMAQEFPEWSSYNYALDDPFGNVDPDGEFVISFITGFLRGLFSGDNPFSAGWRSVKNEYEIWSSFFRGDIDQIMSKLLWQLPQQMLGVLIGVGANWAGMVNSVDHFEGATLIESTHPGWAAFTLGSVIHAERGTQAMESDPLFRHEYGHYLQSQRLGPLYLTAIALPSFLSAAFLSAEEHDRTPWERGANELAEDYFGRPRASPNVSRDLRLDHRDYDLTRMWQSAQRAGAW